MASPTSILNQALVRCGQQSVNDINDTLDDTALLGKGLYEDAVREIGRTYPWNCLMKQATLSQNTTTTGFKYTYSYNLPTNCIRVIRVNGYQYDNVQDVYQIYGRELHTDSDECKIEYVEYTDNTSLFDPLFTAALIVLLASKCAGRIGKDAQKSQALLQEYEQVLLPRAKSIDGKERKRRLRSPWQNNAAILARYTYSV